MHRKSYKPYCTSCVCCCPKMWMSTEIIKGSFGKQKCSSIPETSLPRLCVGQSCLFLRAQAAWCLLTPKNNLKWSRMEQTFCLQIWKKTVALFSAYCVVWGKSDVLRLKKNRLFFRIFNHKGQKLSCSAICLQDEGTSLLNGFISQKKFHNNEFLGNWNLFTISFLFVLDEFAYLFPHLVPHSFF